MNKVQNKTIQKVHPLPPVISNDNHCTLHIEFENVGKMR